MDKKPLYITTTLPYVNADPHIGFALEILQADVLARHASLSGREVFFNTGTDEHGQKIFETAQKAGRDVQEYVDYYASEFKKLKDALGLSSSLHFIRTTEPRHIEAAQEMWKRCAANGDIYKKAYEGLYCVGCEKFLTQKEIVDGKCHIHGKEPVLLKEENYFFKFSEYQEKLLQYLNRTDVVIPEWRRQEAINFVKEGLEDFSISREKARLSWGVPVPGDDTQVMYVWFDALTSYISTLGWPNEGGDFEKFWQEGHVLQMAGKDQIRFQSLIWQAMIMSAGVKNTDQVFYHGFINSGGQKMSKSLGNVINPYELVQKYGTDATRYLLLRHVHSTEDTDVTWEKLDEWYTADLVNGIGNFVARVMKLAEEYLPGPVAITEEKNSLMVSATLGAFDFNAALGSLMGVISEEDEFIQKTEPYKKIKSESSEEKKQAVENIERLVRQIEWLAYYFQPFMPETSGKILKAIAENKKPENLFPRLHD
ncbi:MAG: methionine--tRNA ligase [Patescibacteria group bacterium]